jgi:predicted amidohydrolase
MSAPEVPTGGNRKKTEGNMARKFGVAGIQMNVVYGEDNSEVMLKKLRVVTALFPWVDIIFFSELCLCGVDRRLARPADSTVVDKFRHWARRERKWLIPGSFYEQQDDKIYNTAVVISPDGEIVARYRKMFPWQPLEESAAGGDFCVFDIPGKGRFGLCICYDQWFPEVARTLAGMGAEVVFCPTATITPDRVQEMVMARANAIANQYYWFSLNGVGAGGIGQSVFIDPEGRILQQSGEGERLMTELIDLELVSRVREYGTAGHCQVLKSFGAFKGQFPVYQKKMQRDMFKSLGPIKLHRKLAK